MLCFAFALPYGLHVLLVENAAVGSNYSYTIMFLQAQEQRKTSDGVAAAEAARSLQAELRVMHESGESC